MGSVSGSIDVPAPEATALLVTLLSHAPQQNRELALDGLLRTPDRCLALLEVVQAGAVTREQLGDNRIAALRQHADAAVREAAAKALRGLLMPKESVDAGARARQLVQQRYSKDAFAKGLIGMYQEALSKGSFS